MKELPLLKLLLLTALCLLIGASCQKLTVEKSDPNRPVPDFTVAASDLFRETMADYKKAEAKYAGKQIAVLGKVNKVMPLGKDQVMITLEPGVGGRFDQPEQQNLISIKEGQIVTMQCLGGPSWMSPDLTHCAITNHN